jgi:integrating conjugative element membrane protein (TIGR03747 family)
MNEAVDARPRRYGGFTRLLLLPFTVLGLLCAALFLRLLLEGFGMLFVWPDNRDLHAQMLYEQDRRDLARTSWQDRWQSISCTWLDTKRSLQLTALSNPWIELQSRLEAVPSILGHKTPRLPWAKERSAVKEALSAARHSALSVGIRSLLLLQALPLLILSVLVGIVDGLVQRHVRRLNVQRESGYLHHRAKGLFLPLTLLPGFMYLVLPISVSVGSFAIVSAILSGLMAAIAVGSFKKYL